MGIPFGIQGTTSDPKFMPDVKGLATGFLQNALSGKGNSKQPNPVDNVMGLLTRRSHRTGSGFRTSLNPQLLRFLYLLLRIFILI